MLLLLALFSVLFFSWGFPVRAMDNWNIVNSSNCIVPECSAASALLNNVGATFGHALQLGHCIPTAGIFYSKRRCVVDRDILPLMGAPEGHDSNHCSARARNQGQSVLVRREKRQQQQKNESWSV